MTALYDVAAIGNAIVDVIAPASDDFILAEGLEKGAMTLIDQARGESLYSRMAPGIEASGGSAGNTVAGVASFGGRAAYLGKVADDQLGRVFIHDTRNIGVRFDVAPLVGGPASGRCLVNVTPDGQRTMCTFLGASTELTPDDVKAEIVDFIETQVDLVFANEAEITSLFQTADFDSAAAEIRARVQVAALTRSEKGSVVIAGDQTHLVPASPVEKVVDTTGAGDQYAAGFLFGLASGRPLPVCGRLGALAAAEVISHYGPRPQVSLKALAAEQGI